jgi:hypothetical protein
MANCHQCGTSQLLMAKCEFCHDPTCPKCMRTAFKNYKFTPDYSQVWITSNSICSKCADRLIRAESNQLTQSLFEGPNPVYPNHCLFCGPGTSLEVCSQWINHTFKKRYGGVWVPAGNGYVLQMYIRCPKCTRTYIGYHYIFKPEGLAKIDGNLIPNYLGPDYDKFANYAEALRAEKAGRYEDAANHWEKAGYLEKAKNLRDSNRSIRIDHKHAVLDVNRLVEMLSLTNYTIPYRCPSCGAVIKLNKERSADKFLTCEYCNSSLKAVDVESLIKQVV